jgi:ribosomal protein L4
MIAKTSRTKDMIEILKKIWTFVKKNLMKSQIIRLNLLRTSDSAFNYQMMIKCDFLSRKSR